MPTTSVVFLLLLLFSPATILLSSAAPIPGLDSFLTQQYRIYPKSTNDPFQSLPSSLKKSLSSSSPGPLHIPSMISSLLSLSVPVPLHIRLVGPNSLPPPVPSSLPSSNPPLLPPTSTSSLLLLPLTRFPSATPSTSTSLCLPPPFHLRFPPLFPLPFPPLLPPSVPLSFPSRMPPLTPSFPAISTPRKLIIPLTSISSIWVSPPSNLMHTLTIMPIPPQATLIAWGLFGPAVKGIFGLISGRVRLITGRLYLVTGYYLEVLVVPPLRIPVHFENTLTVQLIHIHPSGSEDLIGLEWNVIEKSFRDEANDGDLLFGSQSLEFKKFSVKYEECSICSFAVSRSTNSFTSRFLFDNYTLIVSEYLDSKRLHQILSDSAEEFRRVAGLPEEDFGSRVLPVYVFDLDYHSTLLLDRYHQTIAFRDMVIAVRTKTAQTVSDYSCNGRHVFTRTRELQRPLVGSILQSMWGVSPTHLIWSSMHNSTLVDYTWSVGQTPFGPFSEVSSLSFVQKDAARRNFILTSLNYSLISVIDVLESIDAHGGDKNLKQKQHVEFIQRWNLFRYKLDKTVSALSHFDFDMAFYYLKSSDHDLYAIHDLVYTASQDIEASLVCFKDPPFPWAALSFSVVGFLALSYVYAKRDKLFRNKRKRF
ncbi:ethylene-responsive transcription factor WRI1-like [Hibiscus syriacus]|uniref:Ethylene-responsive transcription factor WRI1-like n=1 Tax=Hibiscus syriacus TaxID=106335 RepID=A0A6A3CXR0_HIBSY|nr:ethylene-responsive transcription factor WRI1-like [Hibiscus syriacus]